MSILSFGVGGIHIFPYRILIPLIWVLISIRVIRNRGVLVIQPIKIKVFGIFLLTWLVYSIISINWSIDKVSAFKHVIFLFLSISVIVFSVVFFKTADDLRTVSIIWLVFLGLTLIIGVVETITGSHLSVSRLYQTKVEYFKYTPTAFFYNPNNFATFLSISAPFLLSSFLFSKKWIYRLISLLGFTVLIYLLNATRSRANFIAIILVIGYFIVVFFSLQTNRKEIYAYIAAAVMGLLLFPKRIGEVLNDVFINLHSIITQLASGTHSMGERMNLAKNGLMFLFSTWGFGVGAGNVENWMRTKGQFDTGNKVNIHNWYLEVLVNYGIFIFTGYLIFYIGIAYKVFSLLKRA